MLPRKTYFYCESSGDGDFGDVFSFTATSISHAKLYATRRSSRLKRYLLLGDQIDPETMRISNILAVRDSYRGWREVFGKENPYAL